MIRVLSTKTLTEAQRRMLPVDTFSLEEYDALRVQLHPVEVDWAPNDLLVFTSGNTVRACFPEGVARERYQVCCVGRKTARALEAAGQDVKAVFLDAEALAACVIEKNTHQNIVFFSGNRRLDTLPEALAKSGRAYREKEVYATDLNLQKFDTPFDAVLFFSPSGVQAYVGQNSLGGALAVCIGPTTAGEAKKYTDRIAMAPTPEVEAVLQTLINETIAQE
ncbi:uroporphyrinogen-III synthase [Robiginitalea sediminis]|uniref:uroporphyrinogen-III synthase n=1 Tax=Robiginitalea sediminis TaxID=1982593 RepID=UPI000B4B7796|nr:uroporphyrinogen-III synthase [Robiginitalea sediminis]